MGLYKVFKSVLFSFDMFKLVGNFYQKIYVKRGHEMAWIRNLVLWVFVKINKL